MLRVTSLTSMNERQLNKWIKRVGLLLVAGVVLFTGFYVLDRWRAPATPIVDQRVAALEQAVRDDPKDVVSRGLLADEYVNTSRFEDAIVQYDAIIATGEEEELAKFGRGTAYLGLEQYDLAKADFERVVEIAAAGEMANVDRTLEAAYYRLGEIAMKQGLPAEAIVQLEKALAIMRTDADALYLVGTAYAATGDLDKAEAALRSAVAFAPIGWSEPYIAMADVFAKAGKASMAEWAGAMVDLAAGKATDAERRLKAIADDPVAALDAAIWLGLLAETRGDNAGATDWYRKALAIDPDNAEAGLGLTRVGPGPSELPALPTPAAPGGGEG